MSAEVTETEEEILVYAEFEDSVNIEKYRAVHVLGIEEKNPIIQMDENFFTGTKYNRKTNISHYYEPKTTNHTVT